MMTKTFARRGLCAAAGLLAGLLSLAGCGETEPTGGAKGKPGTTETKGGTPQATPPADKPWAEKALAIYESALTDAAAALEKTPPAAEALPKLQAIRDKAIESLVPLGREREAMDDAARKQAESQLRMKVSSIQRSDAFKAYLALVNGPYSMAKMKSDDEKALYKILSDLNIITQYAHFDLLKKQAPEEAERLDIK